MTLVSSNLKCSYILTETSHGWMDKCVEFVSKSTLRLAKKNFSKNFSIILAVWPVDFDLWPIYPLIPRVRPVESKIFFQKPMKHGLFCFKFLIEFFLEIHLGPPVTTYAQLTEYDSIGHSWMTLFWGEILNEHQLLATFWDLILIEQAKGFNLRHMTVLGSLWEKNYYVITKNLRKKC